MKLVTGKDGATLQLQGAWHDDPCELREVLAECAATGKGLTVDLTHVTSAGNPLVALLLLAHGWFEVHGGFKIIGIGRELAATFRHKLVAHVLH
jgi:hypothetical protein